MYWEKYHSIDGNFRMVYKWKSIIFKVYITQILHQVILLLQEN